MSNEELWKHNLNSLENYVIENNKIPSIHSKILNEKIRNICSSSKT